jgi:hypothetical protein
MMQNASTKFRTWAREALCLVLAMSGFVIVAAEFLRGSHLYGVMLGLLIVLGTVDWRVRVQSNPAAGFDPSIFMLLVVLVAHPRFTPVAAWLSRVTGW